MIIGLSGYAQSGKNTVADILGKDYKQISFAQPMRDSLFKLNPIIGFNQFTGYEIRLAKLVEDVGWESAKKVGDTRRLLQVFGTEVGRKMFGEDFWVTQAFKSVKFNDNVVFTDVRFPNEAQAIVDLGGEVWRVNRVGISAVNAHVSEHALDDWRFHKIIENDGTIEELRAKVVA